MIMVLAMGNSAMPTSIQQEDIYVVCIHSVKTVITIKYNARGLSCIFHKDLFLLYEKINYTTSMTADFKNSQNFHLKRTEKIKSLM
jgi:hypothetical protein